MSTSPITLAQAGTWEDRVGATDWDAVRAGLDAYGCAQTGPLLTSGEAAAIAALYPDGTRFRSTVNMARHRFGEGQYRYFAHPFPEAVTALKQALYPRLLPIARDWWTRLGRPAPWPDRLDDWLAACTPPGRPNPRRSCCATGPGTGTPSPGPLRRPGVPAAGGDQPQPPRHRSHRRGVPAYEQRPAPSPAAPPPSSRTGTAWCSPPATARCSPSGAGRRRRSGTACP